MAFLHLQGPVDLKKYQPGKSLTPRSSWMTRRSTKSLFGTPPDGVGAKEGFYIEHPSTLLNMATCHSYSRIKTFNLSAMINNTCAFHFIPGCKGSDFAWRMVCRPNGPIISEIVKEAVKEDNPIKLGLVLHVLADSYSHQDFSGLLSKPNDINKLNAANPPFRKDQFLPRFVLWLRRNIFKDRFDTLFDYLVPAYGHAQALHYPDVSHLQWNWCYDPEDIYYRGIGTGMNPIDNRERYEKAFLEIHETLTSFLKNHGDHKDPEFSAKDTKPLLKILKAPMNESLRTNVWQYAMKIMGFKQDEDRDMLTYDETHWLSGCTEESPPFLNYSKKEFKRRIITDVEAGQGFQVFKLVSILPGGEMV